MGGVFVYGISRTVLQEGKLMGSKYLLHLWDNGQKVGWSPLKPLPILALRQMKGYE